MTADPYIATVQIAAEPDRVFDYFTQPEALTRWMGRRAVLDPRPGGEFTLDIYRINVRGRYLEVDRPRRLVISWGHEGSEILPPGASTVEVSFVPHAGGTLVQVVHRDLPDDEAPKHAMGWPHFLARLVCLGHGEDPGPDPWQASAPTSPRGARRPALEDAIDSIAGRTRFSGVVRVERSGTVELSKAFGLADRGHGIPNDVHTRFAIASGSKGLTALAVVSLIEDGSLDLTTTARSVLGTDLPLVGDDVTVEHLLSHRSGIGDYLDEDAGHGITDYVMPVPVHELATTEQYLAALGGHPAAFAPGERFAYNNGGYVVLALIAERTSGVAFHELVRRRVCEPAGMDDTTFLRSDELPGNAALGYLTVDDPRTNVFHLPVRGSGDGGIYTTAADVSSLWRAFFAGRIVPKDRVAEMVRPRSDVPSESKRYGLGFWLHASSDAVILEGYDAGVSFRSVHDPLSASTHTVISNTSDGAWSIARFLDEQLTT